MRRSVWIAGGVLVMAASTAVAQSMGGFGSRRAPTFSPSQADTPGFMFCRLAYTSVRREPLGQGWFTDYPDSDRNFMVRFSELTTAPVSRFADGKVYHAVVTLDSEELFRCPFLFMSDAGTAGLSSGELERLGRWLEQGGFLWVDDFWGPRAWQQWVDQLRRVLPEDEYPIQEIDVDHPMLRTQYNVPRVPQVPSIQFWRRSGRRATSERGAQTARAHLRGIFDSTGRILVLMSFNTDIADGWEREGEDDEFFYNFSPAAYGLGINVVLYALTH